MTLARTLLPSYMAYCIPVTWRASCPFSHPQNIVHMSITHHVYIYKCVHRNTYIGTNIQDLYNANIFITMNWALREIFFPLLNILPQNIDTVNIWKKKKPSFIHITLHPLGAWFCDHHTHEIPQWTFESHQSLVHRYIITSDKETLTIHYWQALQTPIRPR